MEEKPNLKFRKKKLRTRMARIWCRFCDRTLFTQEWYETENLICCCVECYQKLFKK